MLIVSGYWLQIITPPSNHLITLNVDVNYFIVRMIFEYTLKLLEATISNFNQRIVNYGIQIWDFLRFNFQKVCQFFFSNSWSR